MTPPMDPREALEALGRMRLSETSAQGALSRVAELAKATLPSATDVSVTLVQGKRGHTAAFTGQVAMDLDETQYDQGYGPCLDAASAVTTIAVRDMTHESRWPAFATTAVELGVTGSLSVGLPVTERVLGALNVYSTHPAPFDAHEVQVAGRFADYAAVVVANAEMYNSSATLVEQLQVAMLGRAVIEQAKGVLMVERRCDADEAFRLMSKQSQDTNRKLRDVAAEIVQQAASGTRAKVRSRRQYTGRRPTEMQLPSSGPDVSAPAAGTPPDLA